MPSHNHAIPSTSITGSGGNGWIKSGNSPLGDTSSKSAGGGAAHNNLQPYTTTSVLVKY